MRKKTSCLNQATNEVYQSRAMGFVPQPLLLCYRAKLLKQLCLFSVLFGFLEYLNHIGQF